MEIKVNNNPPPSHCNWEDGMIGLNESYELINIAIATSKIKSLTIPSSQIRPAMHSILCGRIGSMKSSILRIICEDLKVTPNYNLTSANLLGSVDSKTGEPILPAIWVCSNNILAIDDFAVDWTQKGTHGALNTLLGVLEFPKYNKKLSYRCNNYEKKDKGGLYCIVKDGNIKVNTRFTLVANSMMRLWRLSKMQALNALRTRCLIIPFYPTLEELKSMLNGENLYKYKKYQVNQEVIIDKSMYDKLIHMVYEKVQKNKIGYEDFIRTVGDLCRAYSIVGDDERIFNLILRLK